MRALNIRRLAPEPKVNVDAPLARTLLEEKPVTASEKVNVNVVAPVAVPRTLSVIVTVGARVS